MFVHINTNGANEVFISVPSENVEYLEGLVKMLETNTVFIENSFSERKQVDAKITIELGEQYTFKEDSYYNKPSLILEMSPKPALFTNYMEYSPQLYAAFAEAKQTLLKKIEVLQAEKKMLVAELEEYKKAVGESANG